jgi:hypothetical protein
MESFLPVYPPLQEVGRSKYARLQEEPSKLGASALVAFAPYLSETQRKANEARKSCNGRSKV